MTRQKTQKSTLAIGSLIEERLKARTLTDPTNVALGAHLDEDTICAFVEARLGADESSPVVSHLIVCGVCRRTTAELARLESQLDDDESTVYDEGPGRVRTFLDGLATRLIPSSGEDTVFAYQNPVTDAELEAKTEPSSDSESPAKDDETPQ